MSATGQRRKGPCWAQRSIAQPSNDIGVLAVTLIEYASYLVAVCAARIPSINVKAGSVAINAVA
jgi:hypothetical protein